MVGICSGGTRMSSRCSSIGQPSRQSMIASENRWPLHTLTGFSIPTLKGCNPPRHRADHPGTGLMSLFSRGARSNANADPYARHQGGHQQHPVKRAEIANERERARASCRAAYCSAARMGSCRPICRLSAVPSVGMVTARMHILAACYYHNACVRA